MAKLHVQSSVSNASQSEAIATISSSWQHVQFTRSKTYKGYTLLNIPAEHFERLATRLFLHGCQSLACGQLLHTRQIWLTFSCRAAMAAQFARIFPCPESAVPLIVSGDRVLSGAAVKAALIKYREQKANQQTLLS